MLRYKFKELLIKKEDEVGHIIHLKTIATETGTGINTLSRLKNSRPEENTNFETKVLDKLCNYFDCKIEDLVEHIPQNKP